MDRDKHISYGFSVGITVFSFETPPAGVYFVETPAEHLLGLQRAMMPSMSCQHGVCCTNHVRYIVIDHCDIHTNRSLHVMIPFALCMSAQLQQAIQDVSSEAMH